MKLRLIQSIRALAFFGVLVGSVFYFRNCAAMLHTERADEVSQAPEQQLSAGATTRRQVELRRAGEVLW